LFLGHILTDLELPQNDSFVSNRCETCDACLRACPTDAIADQLEFTFSKCISYLTQKGRDEDTHGYLYGCDICQLVCPFNQKAPIGTHGEFAADAAFAFPKLEDIAAMDEETFSRIYGQSALAWRGQKTLQRNARQLIKRRSQKHRSENNMSVMHPHRIFLFIRKQNGDGLVGSIDRVIHNRTIWMCFTISFGFIP
jgi:epoxyqueuosine reductase QueG